MAFMLRGSFSSSSLAVADYLIGQQATPNKELLYSIYSCSTANYGSVNTFVDVNDSFQPNGTRAMFVTPQKVRQADTMDLFYNLQTFVDKLRKKYGPPTSKER